jgi:hypothetical protein
MFKRVENEVWVFDLEWVPDPAAGRVVYDLPESMPDAEVREVMWRRSGATEEEPRPYLKTVLCRIVSVATVIRKRQPGGPPHVTLVSLPPAGEGSMDEAALVGRFLAGLGKTRPQLVGYNSTGADLPILVQRAVAHGLRAAEFAWRPERPWEGSDYFARASDWNVDLKDILGGWARSAPSLHEIASVCGIPGKLDVDGADVVDLWERGEVRRIVQYNECDALTTYLVWLRTAHFAGFLAAEEYAAEQAALEHLLEERAAQSGHEHLRRYLDRWRALRKRGT